jgi:hypothetical protein
MLEINPWIEHLPNQEPGDHLPCMSLCASGEAEDSPLLVDPDGMLPGTGLD